MAVISQEMKKILNSLRKAFLQILRYFKSKNKFLFLNSISLLSVTILLGIHIYFFSVIGMILFPPVKVFFYN